MFPYQTLVKTEKWAYENRNSLQRVLNPTGRTFPNCMPTTHDLVGILKQKRVPALYSTISTQRQAKRNRSGSPKRHVITPTEIFEIRRVYATLLILPELILMQCRTEPGDAESTRKTSACTVPSHFPTITRSDRTVSCFPTQCWFHPRMSHCFHCRG